MILSNKSDYKSEINIFLQIFIKSFINTIIITTTIIIIIFINVIIITITSLNNCIGLFIWHRYDTGQYQFANKEGEPNCGNTETRFKV